jgi:MYXO-CTERM domain-containing protein
MRHSASILAVAITLLAPVAADASQITLTAAAGFPNGRTSNDTPGNAIDGSIATWTWTTEAYNTAMPSYLAIGFDSAAVNRIRLWKDDYDSAGSNAKNLTIAYTTDTNADLSLRSYSLVTDLVNGFGGTELWNGTVGPGATVANDAHDSAADGWGSLMFDTVTATGIRIGFTNTLVLFNYCDGVSTYQACNHYRVAEFEAYNSEVVNAAEPASAALLTVGLGLLASRRRRS